MYLLIIKLRDIHTGLVVIETIEMVLVRDKDNRRLLEPGCREHPRTVVSHTAHRNDNHDQDTDNQSRSYRIRN